MSAIITVENLSKRYLIGQKRPKSDGLRHIVEDAIRAPLRWFSQGEGQNSDKKEFWAVKDVSFKIQEGEVVGLIGRNGAGKSTLLKVLSRITEPTSGKIELDGRVASLLEVGTGFHPDLTGRENIYLNGAILGMSRQEIRRKFDEIVAFSEIEQFLETPVKRYSSGMYVRLAFAVAAHLEPEILIVDEVLAVGDAQFQKKCMGKMQDVSKGGRTILFVSHSMAAISKLCQQCAYMENGRLKAFGPTEEIIPHYMAGPHQADGLRTWDENAKLPADAYLAFSALRVVTPEGAVAGRVDIRKPFTVEVDYRILRSLPQLRIAFRVVTSDGTIAFMAADSADPSYDTKSLKPGRYRTRCFFPADLLNEGAYTLNLSADIPFQEVLFAEDGVLGFSVEQTGGFNTRFPEKWPGAVLPRLKWATDPI